MKKSIFKTVGIFLLALILALPSFALAAPARDMGDMEGMVDEPLQHMLNLLVSAVLVQDEPVLHAENAPSQAFVQTLFGLYNYVEYGTEEATLSQDECSRLYEMFFSQGSYTIPSPENTLCPCITVKDGKLVMDLSGLNETPLAGAYVYESSIRDDLLILKADLYTLWGYFSTPAEQVPETDLTWWAGADIILKRDEVSPYGYTLLSYTLTEPYADGLISDWQMVENNEMEYSLRLPTVLGLADDDPMNTVYESGDGAVSVTIVCEKNENGLWKTAAEDLKKNYQFVYEEIMFSTFTARNDHSYVVRVADESLPYVYTLTMEFPSERQEEYTLYAELIRNSLVVWGLNNG